ncbi:hypothetical protein EDB80DRAFT_627336 [Ilyonectria destructans]|nr:hypothetical protein EDB80DRAFT_627336 [Ilyonectria destructans]
MNHGDLIDNWTVNMSTDTTASDEGVSPAQLEFVSLLILLGAEFIIALTFSLPWYLLRRLERERVGAYLDDLEAARRPFSVENLDQAVPTWPYSKWKAETKDAGGSAERSCIWYKLPNNLPNMCLGSNSTPSIICLETLQDGDMVRHLPCDHIFHSNCITKWFLKQHDTCPVCKLCYMPHIASSSRQSSVAERRDSSRVRETPIVP